MHIEYLDNIHSIHIACCSIVRSYVVVCHAEHIFHNDFSVLELYLANSGKYCRSGLWSVKPGHKHLGCNGLTLNYGT